MSLRCTGKLVEDEIWQNVKIVHFHEIGPYRRASQNGADKLISR